MKSGTTATNSLLTQSDLDEQDHAILREMHGARQAAREGRTIEAFAELTARSEPDEIRRVAKRAQAWAEREYRKLHPEQEYPDNGEFTEVLSMIFNVMAREYVKGLREHEMERRAKRNPNRRQVNTGCDRFKSCDDCTLPDCEASTVEILRRDSKRRRTPA